MGSRQCYPAWVRSSKICAQHAHGAHNPPPLLKTAAGWHRGVQGLTQGQLTELTALRLFSCTKIFWAWAPTWAWSTDSDNPEQYLNRPLHSPPWQHPLPSLARDRLQGMDCAVAHCCDCVWLSCSLVVEAPITESKVCPVQGTVRVEAVLIWCFAVAGPRARVGQKDIC